MHRGAPHPIAILSDNQTLIQRIEQVLLQTPVMVDCLSVWPVPLRAVPVGEWPIVLVSFSSRLLVEEYIQVIRADATMTCSRILLVLDAMAHCPDEAFLLKYDVCDVRLFHEWEAVLLRIQVRNAAERYRTRYQDGLTEEILQCGLDQSGHDYLRTLVRQIAKTFSYRGCFVGRLREEAGRREVETVAMWDRDQLVPNFRYDLAFTPCNEVLSQRRVCLFPDRVTAHFPKDEDLQRLGMSAYMACPIFRRDGSLLGLLGCLHDKPMPMGESQIPVIELFACRAGVELERQESMDHLHRLNEVLEDEVDKRTEELRETNQMMVSIAHRAGMAEIATGVLHNVGNLLNSIQISGECIHEIVTRSNLGTLTHLNQLFDENAHRIGPYLSHDPRGRMIPGYLKRLEQAHLKETKQLMEETLIILENTATITKIINLQQDYAAGPTFSEIGDLNALVNRTLDMMRVSLRRHLIDLKTHFGSIPEMPLQPTKLVQVLNNLLQNAKESVLHREEGFREIEVRTWQDDNDHAWVSVRDSGVGIEAEAMERIFKFGYTTKSDGHGFGLHCSILFMHEMNGEMKVHSEGVDKGAEFLISLPMAKGAGGE
ncbi:GAF domain-containing sensor histidine kinase [Acanthopleuribacter pedis]|uniref:histidine kinase n=1 Tax=Acanthopleuribacter pedis TaxID=442870 RepID=A0A8J7QBT4_9BACT|nr:ATP-binding protein [Acanthopleuribacter pedis]MBO1322726.1 GAF domain-containing protein [Acanthopleuribacter pedis]